MIDLTHARQRATVVEFDDFGLDQTPFLGGVTFHMDRPGSRRTIKITMPPVPVEPDGRRWNTRLTRAKQEGGYAVYPQVNFEVGAPGNAVTVATATAGGRTLPVTGANPHYAVREGQALNVVSGGRTCLYFAAEQVILDADGAGDIVLDVPLRLAASVDDEVNLVRPVIAGTLIDKHSMAVDETRAVVYSFSIKEQA